MGPLPPPRQITPEVSYVLSNCGETAGITIRGVYGAGGNEDGNVSAFSAHKSPGHRDHHGGGQPPTTSVPPL